MKNIQAPLSGCLNIFRYRRRNMIRFICFDLDGTLLPMDQEYFTKRYFAELTKVMASFRDPDELVRVIWKGTEAMVKNDGRRSNEQVFWNLYRDIYGPSARNDEPVFLDFYEKKFGNLKEVCYPKPIVAEIVDTLLSKGYVLVIASNPLFPMIAQRQRIEWAGLDPDRFAYITSYENSSFCKPNPGYYKEILDKIGARSEECLMIGNDAHEDMVAMRLGFQGFLLTECLINKNSFNLQSVPSGGYSDLLRYVQALNESAASPDQTRDRTKG